MKKIIVFLLLFALLAVLLAGCGWNKATAMTKNNDGRIMLIYNDGFTRVFVDTETGVEYFSVARDGTCVMIDSYGNPYLYPAFDAREDRP